MYNIVKNTPLTQIYNKKNLATRIIYIIIRELLPTLLGYYITIITLDK